jgi:hypothetical protein
VSRSLNHCQINPWLDLSIDRRAVLELMLSVRIEARRGGILRFEAQSRAGMCAGLLRTMVDPIYGDLYILYAYMLVS